MRLNEAKLLVVGPGGAGKTSIIEQLLNGTFTPDTKISTHGVVVSRWDEIRSDRDEPIQLNIWDFGGQEIQHSTHEFFLTERAVYLLVINPRQDQRVQDEIYHWLDLIRMNAPDAPVIVALSQQDKYEGHVRDADSLEVVDFVQVSCVEEHEAHSNFLHLKELIEREVRKLEHVSNKLPQRWIDVKAALDDENEDFMTYADYRAKCLELGVDDEEDQQLLARFLHDLGVMLNYAEKIPLEETHILDPRWVTEGVYGIVLSDELKATGGVLEESLVAKLDTLVEKMLRKDKRLKDDEKYEPRYPLSSCRFVLAMMEQFELCHPLDAKEGRYLVPNALPQDRPVGVNELDWEGALRFELHYPQILPMSVFSRFLVYIEAGPDECQFLWREGVVAEMFDCHFQVTMHDRDRQIRVVVAGPSAELRVNVLDEIRHALGRANQTKRGLHAVEWIPLADDPNAGVERDLLWKLARAGKTTHMVSGADGQLREIVVGEVLESIGEFKSRPPLDGLHLEKIEVSNIGCFSHLEINLRDQQDKSRWIAILGENGVGKSTLLRCIAIGLCGESHTASLLGHMRTSFLKAGEDSGSIKIQLYQINSSAKYTVETVITSSEQSQAGNVAIRKYTTPKDSFPWRNIFVSAYGTNRSLFADETYSSYSPANALAGLFDYSAKLMNPDVVFLSMYRRQREIVCEQLRSILMMPEEDGVARSETGMELRGAWGSMHVHGASDGYRSTSNWILDLIGWAILSGQDNLQEISGVVLIDELEQHLHPRWQQMIAARLMAQFPRIQFILTTHTPLLASAAADSNESRLVKLFRTEETIDAKRVSNELLRGLRADQVLTTEAFGLATSLSPHASAQRNRFVELAELETRTETEDEELQVLRKTIADRSAIGETPDEIQRELEWRKRLNLLLDYLLTESSEPSLRDLRDLLRDLD